MSPASPHPNALPWVKATLNYLRPTSEKPRTYTFEPPTGVPATTVVSDPIEKAIINARFVATDFGIDREGFALKKHTSSVQNFYDDEEVKRVYYPEAQRLLKEVTGADRVHVFDHTVRRRVPGRDDRRSDGPRQPVSRVHVDHTAKSGPQRVRDLIPNEADALLQGRVQIINIWRPIRGPLLDAPLAVCDVQTVKPDQLVPSDLVYRDRVGETYSVYHHPDHRWFYYSGMNADEVLLLKCYDSKTDGRARFAPHTAFADPTTPPDAPARESIELRTLVFHTS